MYYLGCGKILYFGLYFSYGDVSSKINIILNWSKEIGGLIVDTLFLNDRLINALQMENRDAFRSEVGHLLKEKGDVEFIKEILIRNPISFCIKQNEKFKALYLLAMLDYLSKHNHYPICPIFDEIRKEKMEYMVYPGMVGILPSEHIKQILDDNAIEEFTKYNICEGDIYDVC